MVVIRLGVEGGEKELKKLKNIAEKFGSKEKSGTFALPFEKRVAVKAGSSYQD